MAAEAKPFQLEILLQQVALLMGDKVETKGLELYIEVQPQVPNALIGDQMRLRQILVNLVNNAVKFTESGEVRIEVGTFDLAGDQIELRINVRDSGIGMSQEQMQSLCFAQVRGATVTGAGVTGLGLAISKRLAELMGGRVGVSSELGRGSSFWFTVRLRRDHPAVQTQNDWSALARWSKPGLAGESRHVAQHEVKTPGDPVLDVLRRIEGVNLDKGLAYMSGKSSLYIKLLRRFVELQGKDASQIRNALQQEDWAQAKRLAHTLKSTVGSLGAVQLQAAASALEHALDGQHPLSEVQALLNELEQQMASLIASSMGVLAELAVAAAGSAATEVTPATGEKSGQQH